MQETSVDPVQAHKALEHYLSLEYPTSIFDDESPAGERRFLAGHPDLPGCEAYGSTPEEAYRGLEMMRIQYLANLVTAGLPVPEPSHQGSMSVGPI